MNSYPTKIVELAFGIMGFEGFLNGAASYNNRNQGNIRWGIYAQKLGATSESPAGFARFPTYALGWDALCQFLVSAASGLNSEYEATMTIDQFFAIYAPATDENDPGEYSAVVCLHAGLNTTDTLASLLA